MSTITVLSFKPFSFTVSIYRMQYVCLWYVIIQWKIKTLYCCLGYHQEVSYFIGLAKKTLMLELRSPPCYEPWISYIILLVHSNLCTTTIIGTQKQWTLLTGGRCSMVIYVKHASNGTSKWWSLFVGGRKLRLDCTLILVLAVFHNFLAALSHLLSQWTYQICHSPETWLKLYYSEFQGFWS